MGILNQMYISIVYMYMYMGRLFYVTCKLYGSERLFIVRLMYKEVVYMS